DAFVQAAALAGQAVQVWSHDEGHHGFDVMDNDAQTRDLIRRSLDWVVEKLGAATPRAESVQAVVAEDGGPDSVVDAH
ncbi:MAG: hypothetical protein ABIJ09_14935, partial [Pseudomonadota bacterium]